MQTYVMTIPRTISKRALRIMIEKNDCKKWIIGKEEGKNGYKHWQIRIETSNDNFFEWMQDHIPTAHVEKSDHGVDECRYETKEGQYVTYSDRVQNLMQRYGKFRPNQERALQDRQATKDSTVEVW